MQERSKSEVGKSSIAKNPKIEKIPGKVIKLRNSNRGYQGQGTKGIGDSNGKSEDAISAGNSRDRGKKYPKLQID